MSLMDALEECKGDSIKLVNGTNKKHKHRVGAWLDTGKALMQGYYYIILEFPDPEDSTNTNPNSTNTYLESFRSLKTNCKAVNPSPTTYIQAAFQQIPQLGERLTSFAKMATKCQVRRCRELSDIIKDYLDLET